MKDIPLNDNRATSFSRIARNDSIELHEVIPPPTETTSERVNDSLPPSGTNLSASVVNQVDNNNDDDNKLFSVFPALERSQSFLRRRLLKREQQQQRWEQKVGKQPQKKNDDNSSLEDNDEEEMLRRSSNHGKFGVLLSSHSHCSCSNDQTSYRRDRLIRDIDAASQKGYGAVLKTLRDAGILVYIIDAKVCITLHEMVDSIHQVIEYVCRDPESRQHPRQQQCLLYRDIDGRLFNLTLTSEFTSLEGTWKDLLSSFSILQALVLVTFLTRPLSCAVDVNSDILQDFRPAYLALVLGLVFSEEISLSWTNVAILVRGMPSVSAYAITSNVGSDWPRKILILVLAIASYTTGTFQKVCTLGGVTLTCLVVLANLGSRSWKYLHWKPTMGMKSWCFGICTPLDPIMAYVAAIMMGICFPYLGHRRIQSGGTGAMESVLRLAVLVAGLFILSDYDEIQKFLVVGSEDCNQDFVNFSVGAWWTISLVASLTMLLRKELHKSDKQDGHDNPCLLPDDEEPLLQENQASPVGYSVPHLPDFPIDPSLTYMGWVPFCCCSVGFEYLMGVVVAVGVGGFICYLGLTDLDDEILANAF
ncbi:hypothetical protein IV203_016541 [Nitzschia inconspicua]|uniref:Uncharacterized protein n=1 Tax=Nitzschia inconspicua TaxID=303405 RepID=A0A9K3KQS8_9STRA|nr:hypothetical protein IV203_016541 [Nitzschia inconspicua]